MEPTLPTDSKQRKDIPITCGLLDYFPDAVAAVAHVSKVCNDQHNPGEPMHWAREKSTDHADCIARHLIERGLTDSDGLRHSAKLAWRALALLQTEIESARQIKTPKAGQVWMIHAVPSQDHQCGKPCPAGICTRVAGY